MPPATPSDPGGGRPAAPLVSIVILTYNEERWVEEAVRSAVGQDYPRLEVLVADDASTDGTAAIVSRIADEFPDRVAPMLGEENVGVTRNCNRALRACNGRYVAFCGGDDALLPGKIRAQVEWLKGDEERVLCTHDVEIVDEDGRVEELLSARGRLRAGRGARG